MARPIKEGLDYFPHDTDAVNDEKLEALRALYGNDGYAFFFILLERIYRSPNSELAISDAETIQILSKKVGVTEQKFNEMLVTALKRRCFDDNLYKERGVLTSNGIKKRAVVVIEKREQMRSQYQKTKLKTISSPISSPISDEKTREETLQSKVKKRKEKKSTVKKPDNNLPDWLNKETWDAFLEMRKEKKAPPTDKAKTLLIAELEKLKLAGDNPNEVLNQSIMRNYTGVFPLNKQGGQNGANSSAGGSYSESIGKPLFDEHGNPL
ncbi:MAG: DUF4373 domain-containing protein [Dehalococcoidales bacterium]|nr:DUF4373 domain-containing protein [Dehalococcoidales bacterium]